MFTGVTLFLDQSCTVEQTMDNLNFFRQFEIMEPPTLIKCDDFFSPLMSHTTALIYLSPL